MRNGHSPQIDGPAVARAADQRDCGTEGCCSLSRMPPRPASGAAGVSAGLPPLVVAGALLEGAVLSRIDDFGALDCATSVSRMLVAKKAAASAAVVRVRRLAVPRPVRNAAAATAADAERAAFRALQQHDADQRRGDHQMENQESSGHGSRGLLARRFEGVLYQKPR